jgi:hypothetical protein
MPIHIQLRRGTLSQWAAANPVLFQGEIGLETDTRKFKLGDGTTAWNSLPYGGVEGPTGTTGPMGVPAIPRWTVGSNSNSGQFKDESTTSGERGFLFNPVDIYGFNRDYFFQTLLATISVAPIRFTVYKDDNTWSTITVSQVEHNRVTVGSWWVSGPVITESSGFSLTNGDQYNVSYGAHGPTGTTGPTGNTGPTGTTGDRKSVV